jgi:hypothetical protein
MPHTQDANLAILALAEYSSAAAEKLGSTIALDPGNRVPFRWPPHPVSWEYNVHSTDWTSETTFQHGEESFQVELARTPAGVFGRCQELWLEARGESVPEMLMALAAAAQPLFARQELIAQCIGREGRFSGQLRELTRLELLKLLYCPNRDVAHEARVQIESHASDPFWLPCLIWILNDRTHPYRRVAQWCVLDLFEALPTFAGDQDTSTAVRAIRGLIWDAEDDYARVMYKAGVVLGGHLPHIHGGPTLLECLTAPSPIGRRSAIHGLYHVVEWQPEMKTTVVSALQKHAETEPVPELRIYAKQMALDIEFGEVDHVIEPTLASER